MKKSFYGKVLSAIVCLNAVGNAQTIWTEADFPTPKGHTWINPGNYEYGGDVHIQNINPVNFASNMSGKPNTGVLSIENGGKLTADGEVIVEQLGPTTGDAVLITDGGKAYFNGGLTAVNRNINNDYYVAGTIRGDSQLHVKGNTTLLSEYEKGYGLYLGEGTTNSFNKDSSGNGIVNISTGVRGIHSIGNTDFNQEVHVKLNANGATGVLTLDTASSSLTNFNEKVYITNNSVSNNTSTAYGIAVNNVNGVFNLNDGAVIEFGDTYTNGNEIGLYSGKGTLNVQGDLNIKTNSGNIQSVIYATNNGTIDITNSVADLKGDILSNNGARITMDIKDGSKWEGASRIGNSASTDISMTGTVWQMTDDSDLTNFSLLDNSVVYLNSDPSMGTFTPRTLTISDNYTGNNGTIVFNTKLEDDFSATDKLNILGNTLGTTKVQVRNAGGTGAHTIDGIELISVGGTSDGEFVKDGRIVAGAYEYFLSRGNGGTTNYNNWYLTSKIPSIIPPTVTPPVDPTDPGIIPPEDPAIVPPDSEASVNPPVFGGFESVFRPESGSYIANNAAVNSLFLHRLHDRLGDAQYTDSMSGQDKVTSIWVRSVGGYNTFKDTSGQLDTKGKSYVIQAGGDIADWSSNGSDRFHLGVMGGYGTNHNKTNRNMIDYSSKGKVEGYNIGIYGTWYSNKEDRSGLYADSWLMYNWFDNEVNGDGLDKETYSSKGLTASLEGGYTFEIDKNSDGNAFFIQPKAQAVYMGVKTDNHTESNGTIVELSGDGNIQTRLGVRLYTGNSNFINRNEKNEFQPFIEANWIHNTKEFGVIMDGVENKQSNAGDLAEVKLGTELKLNQNFDLWGNVAYQWGGSNYNDTQVTVGLKYRF